MHDIAKQWLDADYDLRLRFQSMLFPEGATLNMETMQFGTEKNKPTLQIPAKQKRPFRKGKVAYGEPNAPNVEHRMCEPNKNE